LVGFSTSGKSTIVKRLEEKYAAQGLVAIDTDKRVAMGYVDERDGDAHIYELFFQRLDGRNTKGALDYIEARQRVILNWIIYSARWTETGETSRDRGTPRLIAAGPFLPMMPEWSDFVRRKPPTIFLLDLTSEEVYDGLMKRRERHEEMGISKRPGFGCWDEGVLTTHDNGQWVLLPKEVALEKIKTLLARAVMRYKQYCGDRVYKARDETALAELDLRITESLGFTV
jgi:hypothetical protein